MSDALTEIVVAAHPSQPVAVPATASTAARHAARAERSVGELTWQFIRRGRPQYLPLLLSDFGRDIVTRKYDAFTTDKAYGCPPRGALGPIGRALDRFVASLPVHETLRQRLAVVTGALAREARAAQLAHAGRPVRLLSAPCGLGRDILTAAATLRAPGATAVPLAITGADLDATGDVLAELRRRAAAARLDLLAIQDDLFHPRRLPALIEQAGRFDIVNCIGLVSWLAEAELAQLLATLRDYLEPGGVLLVDNFRRHSQSHLAEDLEVFINYHDDDSIVRALAGNGYQIERWQWTANGVAYVVTARAV